MCSDRQFRPFRSGKPTGIPPVKKTPEKSAVREGGRPKNGKIMLQIYMSILIWEIMFHEGMTHNDFYDMLID